MMRNKRSLDDLSVTELERALAEKKRAEIQERLKRMQREGRIIGDSPVQAPVPQASVAPAPPPPPPQPVVLPGPTVASTAILQHTEPIPQFEDEIEAEYEYIDEDDKGNSSFWKSFSNQILMLVEVAAVAGLVFLGYNMFSAIGTLENETALLERETAAAQQLAEDQRRASIVPTPQLSIDQVVLPSGHTPPTEPGGGQFNWQEIPGNLLPLVQNQVLQPVIDRPLATQETALRLIIPKINVDNTIVQGTDWDALRLGIGQIQNGINPGDDGNLVLSAHNDIYGEIFRFLDQLEPGDNFQVLSATQTFEYVIRGWEVVPPTAVHVMDSQGRPTATLISCYPYHVDTQRIVVFADQI